MVNLEHLAKLQEGVEVWNRWRDDNLGILPALWAADLEAADLREADLKRADLEGADLSGADLRDADLRGAKLRGTDLRGASLCGADFGGTDLKRTDLDGANLRGDRYLRAEPLWVGYFKECPEHWSQGETVAELKKGLLKIYETLR